MPWPLFGRWRQPADAEEWLERGRLAARQGRWARALRCWKRAAELAPDDGEVWKVIGLALTKLGKYEAAIQACDRALEVDPGCVDARILRRHAEGERSKHARG